MEAAEAFAFRDPELRQRVRQLVQEQGWPIRFTDRESYEHPGEFEVSYYGGWVDYDARDHVLRGDCSWIIEPEARLVERVYAEFTDTIDEGRDEVGINITPVGCACGAYQNMHLRYTASLGEVLRHVLGTDDGIII